MDFQHKYEKYKQKYLSLKIQQDGGNKDCVNNCGRNSTYPACCLTCNSVSGPHTPQCDSRSPKCIKSCGMFANSGKGYNTCCNSCNGPQSVHTNVCSQRNNQQHIPQQAHQIQHIPQQIQHINDIITFETPLQNVKKSAFINKKSNLFNMFNNIYNSINSQFPCSMPYGNSFHVELVDDPNDNINKSSNYGLINNKQIDLCSKDNWYFDSLGFAFKLGQYPGHFDALHVTIGHFGKTPNCNTLSLLPNLRKLVEQVIGKKLH
jgi:hypothetical protein